MKNKGLIGKKLGITQIFDEEGNRVPVTVIEAGPCVVLEKRTLARDGYSAIQMGFGSKKLNKTNKPDQGNLKKAGASPQRIIREIRLADPKELEGIEIGSHVKVDIFQPGEIIRVTGTSKGKGFAGVMKRHHFKGFRASHGTHEHFRHGGAVGMHEDPGHVLKGKKMPGHLGDVRVTQKGCKIIKVVPEENLLLIRGPVPGANGGFVIMRSQP